MFGCFFHCQSSWILCSVSTPAPSWSSHCIIGPTQSATMMIGKVMQWLLLPLVVHVETSSSSANNIILAWLNFFTFGITSFPVPSTCCNLSLMLLIILGWWEWWEGRKFLDLVVMSLTQLTFLWWCITLQNGVKRAGSDTRKPLRILEICFWGCRFQNPHQICKKNKSTMYNYQIKKDFCKTKYWVWWTRILTNSSFLAKTSPLEDNLSPSENSFSWG